MTNSISPKVSVCIPVYNGSEYIAESIESILAQTYKDFHIIVCDNCSTDNTEEIVRSFSDSRITYARNDKNLGLVGNANRCLELANGKYVYILHHDDVMLPENLELKVRLLDENPKVGLVHSDVLLFDQAGKTLDLFKFKEAKSDYIEDGKEVFQRYIMDMPVGASFFIGAVLARRDCYLQLGGFSPMLPNTNDSEMWMRILLFYDVACVGKPLVKYRLHNMMTSTSINDVDGLNIAGLEEHYLASNTVIEKYKDRIPQWKNLKNKVSTAFAMKAVSKGSSLLRNRKISLSAAFFKTSIEFCPLIFFKKALWLFIVKLMIRKLKELFKRILLVVR